MPDFKDIKTWTEQYIGHLRLRSFTDEDGHLWLKQNIAKESKWAELAREGHQVAWEFESQDGSYSGDLDYGGSNDEVLAKYLNGSTS